MNKKLKPKVNRFRKKSYKNSTKGGKKMGKRADFNKKKNAKQITDNLTPPFWGGVGVGLAQKNLFLSSLLATPYRKLNRRRTKKNKDSFISFMAIFLSLQG